MKVKDLSEITVSDEERFTDGDCHVLAIELHKSSNGVLQIAVTIPTWHAFAVHKETNMALDIDGYRHVDDLLIEWGLKEWMCVEEDFFSKNYWTKECYYGSEKIAKEIAPKLLKEYNV